MPELHLRAHPVRDGGNGIDLSSRQHGVEHWYICSIWLDDFALETPVST